MERVDPIVAKAPKFCETMGLRYFPLLPGEKKPATAHGFRATAEEIEQVLQNKLDYNFAIICGKMNGNLVVLDFEFEKDAYDFFGDRAKLFASTFCVRTAHGGLHVYLRTLDKCPRRKTKICAPEHSFDVCGEGGYVVAPGSVILHKLCPRKKEADRCAHTDTCSRYEIVSKTIDFMLVNDLQKFIDQTIVRLGWNDQKGPTNLSQTPTTFQQLFTSALIADEELRELYQGHWQDRRKSRSEGEFVLCIKLVKLSFPDDCIRDIMDSSKIGKWQDKEEAYRNLTIEKARLWVAERAVTRLVMKSSITRSGSEGPRKVIKEDARW